MTIPPLTELVFSAKTFSITVTPIPGGSRCYCLAAEASTLEGIAERVLGPQHGRVTGRGGRVSWSSRKFTIMGREHELEFRGLLIERNGEDIAGWRSSRQLLPNGRDWIEVLIIND